MQHFNTFDIISIALVLFLGLKGILRGFVKEFFALVGIIGGIYFGSRYALKVGEYIDINFLNIQNKSSLYLIGFIVVFISFWFISSILGSFFSKIVNSNGSGVVDKIFGFLVGSAKIFFIISIMIYIISSIEVLKTKTTSYFQNSFMYPIFLKYGKAIVKLDRDKKIQTKVKESIKIIENNITK